jgi:hypothetical protein
MKDNKVRKMRKTEIEKNVKRKGNERKPMCPYQTSLVIAAAQH